MLRHLACLPIVLVLTLPADAKARRTKAPAQAPFNRAVVNDPKTTPDLAEKAAGPGVLRAQVLLDRAHFSIGEIDGVMGTNALHAVAGFRAARGLPPGNSIDAEVWKALNMDSAPALVEYALSEIDVKGPFVPVPADMMAKVKLTRLGYASPLEGIAEKFHINPALLQKLNPGKTFKLAGEKIFVPNVSAGLEAKAARVVVSKSDSTVRVLDDAGKVIAQYPATSGSEHDPLPIGEWQITGVFKNPKFNYNPDLFWDASPKDTKATIPPGPNNPVGAVWIDISKEHYGIHGTPSPALIGHAESHGCIRLTNWDAMELAGMVTKGTPLSLTE
jgi:lipoprotein-anchoring transpeptidase ErfK/SrfK